MKKQAYIRIALLLMITCIIVTGSKAQTIALSHAHSGGFTTLVNPAFSLMHGKGSLSFIGRQQWVGLEGAPKVYWGHAHLGLSSLKAATGIQFGQDNVGVEKQTQVSLFFAKSIRLSEKDYLGMSLSAGLIHFDARYSGLDGTDPSFQQDINESDALLGMGITLYRPEHYYVGVSIPRFTSGGVGLFGNINYHFENQYFLSAGYLHPIGENIHIKPSLILSHKNSTKTTVDASAMVFAKRAVGIGLGLRSQGDLSGKLHINYAGIGIGYSYQFNPKNQPLNRYINNTSHEIAVSYNFDEIQGLL